MKSPKRPNVAYLAEREILPKCINIKGVFVEKRFKIFEGRVPIYAKMASEIIITILKVPFGFFFIFSFFGKGLVVSGLGDRWKI